MNNLANTLTVARIVLIPVLVGMMLWGTLSTMWGALALYIVIAATDWFDGWIARKFNQMSDFGRFLDPIADKILVAAMFITMAYTGAIFDGWLALPIIIMAREFLVAGLREFLGPKGVVVHVTKLAKWKTATQMIALGFLVMAPAYAQAETAGLLLLSLATVLTVVTGWDYMKGAMPHFKQGQK